MTWVVYILCRFTPKFKAQYRGHGPKSSCISNKVVYMKIFLLHCFSREGVRSTAISVSVCMFVCLSLVYLRKPHVQISRNFLHMLHVDVARSSFDVSAISYVLPVLAAMTSCFHIQCNGANWQESKTSLMFRRVRQVAAPWAKLLSTIASLSNLWRKEAESAGRQYILLG